MHESDRVEVYVKSPVGMGGARRVPIPINWAQQRGMWNLVSAAAGLTADALFNVRKIAE